MCRKDGDFFIMAIVKSKHASNFTVIPNNLFKQNLSMEAIGLLTYLLSLPSDWVIYKTTLHKYFSVGPDKLDRVFKELQENGYIISVKVQNEAKTFEWNHVVYDKPFNGEPSPENTPMEPYPCFPPMAEPPMANPLMDQPPMANKGLLKTNIQRTNNKELNTKSVAFDLFWNLYDKKTDRDKCESKWNKLKPEERELIVANLPLYVKSTPDKQYRKNPETYLNQKGWLHEIILKPTEKKYKVEVQSALGVATRIMIEVDYLKLKEQNETGNTYTKIVKATEIV